MTSTKSQTDEPEFRPAKLLSDQPIVTDEFESGGHERSAQALAQCLTQLKDRDGAIGLEGRWGAGKSSVIRLAERALKEKKEGNHHIFCFDLWAHQSDDFRRTFLEEFIGWLDYDHLTTSQAEEFRDQIRDRTKTIKFANNRKYSWAGAVFILLAPLFPLILAWLSPFAFSGTLETMPAVHGLSASMVSLVVLVGLYVLLFVRTATLRGGASKDNPKRSFPEAFSVAVKVFTRDEETRTETQHIREEDPTTLEFQKLFRNILSKVQSDSKRLVLVFDNIDRLPPEKVVDVWAEVRSVFTETDSSQFESAKAITVVVPYDFELISEAFDYEYEGGVTDNSVLDPDQVLRRSQAKDLIEKTFDVTIKVSPPLSLDWQKFLNAKIDRVFHYNVTEETQWRLFRLFDLHCQQNRTYPTPRLIISYVNAIGTLWNQWHSEISLESMALYVLFRQEIESSPNMLKRSVPIHERFIQIAQQGNWRRHIAAIHFNVNTEIAYQVLAGTDISSALETEDLEQLDELQQLEFFEGVLVEVISDSASNWARDGMASYSAIIRALTHVDSKSEAVNHSWKLLAGVVNELQSIDVRQEHDSMSMVQLLEYTDHGMTKDVGKCLLERAAAGLPEESKRLIDDGSHWTRFTDAILGQVAKDERKYVYRSSALPGGVDFTLGVAIASEACEHIEFNDLWKSVADLELASAVIELAANNPSFVKSFATSKPKFFSAETESSCIDAFGAKLRAEDCEDELVGELLDALLVVRSKTEDRQHIQGVLEALVADGTLAWYFGKACSNENSMLIGKILFCFSEATQGGAAPTRVPTHTVFGDLNPAYVVLEEVYAEEGVTEEVASSIAQEVIRARSFSAWCRWAINDEDDGFYQVIFRRTAALPNYYTLDVEAAVVSYPRIHEILGNEGAAHYLNVLQGWDFHMPKKFAGKKSLSLPLLFLDHVEAFGATKLRNLVTLLQKYFSALGEADWTELLKKSGDGFKHLRRLIEKENYVPPAGEFRPTLMALMNAVFDEEVKPTDHEGNIDVLLDGLSPATKEGFLDDFLRGLGGKSASKTGVLNLLTLFPVVSRELPFTRHAEIAIDRVFIPVIWTGQDTVDHFLQEISEQIVQCLDQVDDKAKARVLEAIEGLEILDDDEKLEWAAGLRQRLGFPTMPVEPDEEGQTPDASEGG